MEGEVRKKLGILAVKMRQKMVIVKTVKLRQTIGTVKRVMLMKLSKGFRKGNNSINVMYNMFPGYLFLFTYL
jgi:hypothetical protein